MAQDENRRPLASRDSGWARTIARKLSTASVTPNQISMASMVMAAVAGIAFWQAGTATGGSRIALLLVAALFCQFRLLCNLFDGMVAIEGGKQAPDGPFWNEFPDRIADILIFAGAGYGIANPGLGWAAAAFAVLTAYVRELGRATGNPSDFGGPMAKQHRMAVMTVGALLGAAEAVLQGTSLLLTAALWIVAVGAFLTALRRGHNLVRQLKKSNGLSP